MDISCYRKANESFRRRLVCRIGIDSGFFVEMNYMVNAMLYCLAHRIQFQLYSDDANFGTGVGWREYFQPFCEEVHESFHQKYNFHRLPSWQHILKQCCSQKSIKPFVWKVKKSVMTLVGRLVALGVYKERVLFAQYVPRKTKQWYYIPELGIDADYTSAFAQVARMVWQLHPDIQRQKEIYQMKMSLPSVFSGVQIRGGDKITEAQLIDGKTIIQRLALHDGESLFVLTDDYRQFLKARADFPRLRLFTLCQEDEMGYYHQQFCQEESISKKNAIVRLIISVDLLLSSKAFVGSITTGPSVFIMKLRHHDSLVQAIDCSKSTLPSALQLPIYARSIISRRNLQKFMEN